MAETDAESDAPSGLNYAERRRAAELTGVKAPLIYEAIRMEGEHEWSRPTSALWWSGVAAGLAISLSVLCKGFLEAMLPAEPWRPAVANLGYAVGFLVVILGRMQLFTENTITPILPLLLNPTRRNFDNTARLWGIVFAANMVGCLFAAAALAFLNVVPETQMEGILYISRHYAGASFMQHLAWGAPAGFMVAALVWLLPSLEGSGELLAILIVTYMIGVGGLSHVVAGSTELFLLALLGEIGWGKAVFGGVLPSLIGNVLGGTGLFAVLTYAQVREEL
jgi:formate/nitrite transporter FocA (FNT family)